MTKEQAALFFRHQQDDDLEEMWEQRFFGLKQFFLTHVPLKMLWSSKISRISKEYEAYLVLLDLTSERTAFLDGIKNLETEAITGTITFSKDFIEAFNEFHALRNQFKSAILQTNVLLDFIITAKKWLQMEGDYSLYWFTSISESDSLEVLRSKESDPMELLADLKEIRKKNGIITIDELKLHYNKLPENVKKEMKRLSLLSKN